MHYLITLIMAIASPWPSTPAASMAQQWVDAFPSETAMRAFLAKSVDPQDLQKRSIDERMSSWRETQKKYKTLKFASVVSSKPHELKVMLASADGEKHEFTFTVQDAAPHKLVSISRIEYEHVGHSFLPFGH